MIFRYLINRKTTCKTFLLYDNGRVIDLISKDEELFILKVDPNSFNNYSKV